MLTSTVKDQYHYYDVDVVERNITQSRQLKVIPRTRLQAMIQEKEIAFRLHEMCALGGRAYDCVTQNETCHIKASSTFHNTCAEPTTMRFCMTVRFCDRRLSRALILNN